MTEQDDWQSIVGKALEARTGLSEALGPKNRWEGRFELRVHLPIKTGRGRVLSDSVDMVLYPPERIDVSKEIRAFARAAKKERRDRRRGARALRKLTKGLTWVGGPGPLDTNLYGTKHQWRGSKSFLNRKGKRK